MEGEKIRARMWSIVAAASLLSMVSTIAPAFQSFAEETSYKVKVENVPGGYVKAYYWIDRDKKVVYLPVGETSTVPAGAELRIWALSGYWDGLRTTGRKLLVNGEDEGESYKLTVDQDLILSAEFEQEETESSSDNGEDYTWLNFKNSDSTDIYIENLNDSLDEPLCLSAPDETIDYTESPKIDYVWYEDPETEEEKQLDGNAVPFVIENGHLKMKEGAILPDGRYDYNIHVDTGKSNVEEYLWIRTNCWLSARAKFVKMGNGYDNVNFKTKLGAGADLISKYYDGSQFQIANHPFVSASFSDEYLEGKTLADQTAGSVVADDGFIRLNVKFKDFTPAVVLPKKNLSEAFYEEQPSPFKDVKESSWSESYIKYAYYNGLMTGKSETKFDPTGNFTRAEAVQVLYAAAGKPDVEITDRFSDLNADWYKKAVSWAVEKGITSGTGDGSTFSPDAKVTKEQLALFLMKYAEITDKDISARHDVSAFGDAGQIDSWAREAVEWANASGIINGDGTNINPQGGADRQTAATMFCGAMRGVLADN